MNQPDKYAFSIFKKKIKIRLQIKKKNEKAKNNVSLTSNSADYLD